MAQTPHPDEACIHVRPHVLMNEMLHVYAKQMFFITNAGDMYFSHILRNPFSSTCQAQVHSITNEPEPRIDARLLLGTVVFATKKASRYEAVTIMCQ